MMKKINRGSWVGYVVFSALSLHCLDYFSETLKHEPRQFPVKYLKKSWKSVTDFENNGSECEFNL